MLALTLLKGWLRSGHCEADDLNHDPSWPVDGDVVILEEFTLMSTEVLFCNNIIIVINFVLVGLQCVIPVYILFDLTPF